MIAIPFPLSSNPGRTPGEGSGRLVNCFAVKDGEGARYRPTPGLAAFATLPDGELRGAIYDVGLLRLVAGTQVVQIDGGGGQSMLEQPLPGSGPVTISRNNAAQPDTVIVCDTGAFVLSNGVVKPYPDTTLGGFGQPNSVTFLDGYFLFTFGNGKIVASDLNTTSINDLSFTTAEARPDGLLRGIVYGQQFFAFGQETIEVYQDVGSTPFPLQRTSVIPQGLFGPWAVAGFGDGWAGPLIFVSQDHVVRMYDGTTTPPRISGEDLERLISKVANPTSLRASVYTTSGNAVFSLSSPTWTWEYNVTTQLWHEREGYGGGRWRGGLSISAFGEWIVGDEDGGALYWLNADTRMDGPDPLIWGLDSGPAKQFPARIATPSAAFDFVQGAALNPDAMPQVMLSWSHDGGAVWSNPVAKPIGKQGRYRGRTTINRVGLTSPAGVRWRFRMSDPAYTSFSGGVMEDEVRR